MSDHDCGELFQSAIDTLTARVCVLDTAGRERAEQALKEVLATLERRVGRRMGELVAANAELARELVARRETEAVLKRFEMLAEHSRDIILFIGYPDGEILEANRAAQRAYGYTRDELLGLTIRDLRADDTKPAVDGQMQLAHADGLLFETFHRRRDGRAFPVEVSSRGVTETGGRILLSVIRDISDRKRVEDERERLIAQLREAIERVKTLRGIVPICASCKKIRNDSGYWEQVEVYIRNHTDAEFSHSLCADCVSALYPDLGSNAGNDPPAGR